MANVAFDSISPYFYVSIKFNLGLDIVCDMLITFLYVSTLVRDSVVLNQVYYTFSIVFKGFQSWVDLIIIDILDLDIILYITWLSLYYVILRYNAKTVTLEMLRMDKLELKSVYKLVLMKIISLIQEEVHLKGVFTLSRTSSGC